MRMTTPSTRISSEVINVIIATLRSTSVILDREISAVSTSGELYYKEKQEVAWQDRGDGSRVV
jgi:hypothetical protein